MSLQERSSQLVFKATNLTTQRGLRNVKSLCSSAHAALFGNGDEVLQLRKAHELRITGEVPRGHTQKVLVRTPRPSHVEAMRIERLSSREQDAMRAAGKVAAATLAVVAAELRPGMTTADIDALVRRDTKARGARPSQLGYHGFPGAVCTSPNDVVCHGIPRSDVTLRDGDLVSVDVTSQFQGWHGDTCATFALGSVGPEYAHVLFVARACCELGIAEVRNGVRLGDIGHVVDAFAKSKGCSVVREVGGHGIGRKMHQAPHVSFFGQPGRGRRLREGMCITIEPIVMLGSPDVVTDSDGWTMRTSDGSPAAQFEHTVLVTRSGCEVLTRQ